MARDLLPNLNAATFSHRRSPAHKLYVYDVRSTSDTIDDVVLGNELSALTGPRDFTPECQRAQLTEVAGDYVESGVASSSLVVDVANKNDRFNPFHVIALPTGDGRWLREGNVVRIKEGDEGVDESEWEWTFTGQIVGQAGVDRGRVGIRSLITFKALSREAQFVNVVNTTKAYPGATNYLTMAEDIAEVDMALPVGVIDFPTIGSRVTRHIPVQFVKESPLATIAHIFLADLYMPRFNGEGKLTATSGIVTQAPVRVYEDEQAKVVVSIVQPHHGEKRVNAVRVTGLDAGLTKTDPPRQELAGLELTTGYFAHDEKIEIYWSEDQTLLAEDGSVSLHIIQSVNGGLSVLGGGESFSLIPAPNVDEEGSIGAILEVSTGFAPHLMVMLTATYIHAATIPDQVFTGGTIPVGRIVQAVILVSILLIMTMIGRGSYQFIGKPYQYVHREVPREARQTGVTHATRNGIEIKNHLLTSGTLVKTVARELLFRRASMSAPRVFQMLTDLRLEPDDVFEYNSRRYLVSQISRTLGRLGDGISQVSCYEVTPGVYA